MNYPRIVIAAIAAWIAYFAVGFLIFGKLIAPYYAPFPGVYRPAATVMTVAPFGMIGMLVALVVFAVIYAKGYEGGSGLVEGLRFGLLIGIFFVGAVVGDEYVTLNIGGKLALAMALGRLAGWTIMGVVVGLIYRPKKLGRGVAC